MSQTHNGKGVIATEFIKQVDISEETPVPTDGIWEIKTKHSLYIFDADEQTMTGGIFKDNIVPAKISGTTFGGSMIKPGVLIPGAYMEFVVNGRRYTSSAIQSVTPQESTPC